MPAEPYCRLAGPTGRAGALVRLSVWAALAVVFCGPSACAETLTLADCLRETLEHNPLIIQKRLALEEAAGTRLVFHAHALPTFSVGGLGGQQGQQTTEVVRVTTKVKGQPAVTTTDDYPRKSTLFLIGSESLYQPIFDAAIPANWRRGNLELAVARSNFLVAASSQLNAAHVQFYQALYRQGTGTLLREIGDSVAANVKGQGQLMTAGVTGQQALLQAQVQQVNFLPQVLANTGAQRTSLTTLLQTMGRPLGPGAAPEGSITLAGPWEDGALNFDAAAMAKETRARRPDLQALRDMVRANTEDANIQRGGYYPTIRIYLTGELLPASFVQGQRSNAVRPEDNTQETEISPGIQETWNVIDTGQVRGAVGQTTSLRDALAISLHHLEQDVPSELNLVRAQLDNAARQRELFAANVGISANTLDMIKAGVAQGTNSQLEFLDAQTAVLSTRTGLLAAELNLSLAHAEYDRVTGGYLRLIGEDKPASAAPAPK